MLIHVVETDCGPVEYSEAGTGDPVLYFHGAAVTGDVMLTVETPMIDAGFRLIVPNRPGYGKTPLSPHYSAADCARVAAALLDSLGIADVGVMGSYGGAAFAASFALHHPHRARSLVLLCPQLHRWDHKRWLPKASRWTLPLLKRPFLRTLLLKLYRMQLRRMTATQLLKTEAGDRYPDVAADPASQTLCTTTLAAMGRGATSAGFENDIAVFANEDVLGGNRVVQTPTLVIHDVEDPLAPVEHVDWFVSHCRQCERVSLHTGGHLIWVGPDAGVMHQTRVRFLKEHASRAG
jgi:pimeloyl-ACP methyl ester carboxylesterase